MLRADSFHLGSVLILIRHGESHANAEGLLGGQTNSPLTERGQVQAQQVAEFLALNETVEVVVTSDLQRAADTASTIAARLGLEVVSEPGLREFDIGTLSDWTLKDVRTRSDELAKALWTSQDGFKPYGGESTSEFENRIETSLVRLNAQYGGRHLVIVSHQAVINWILHGLLRVSRHPLSAGAFFGVRNGTPTKVKVVQGPMGRHMWRIDYVGIPLTAS